MRARSIMAGALAALTVLATGCLTPDAVQPDVGAIIRFVNATNAPLDVLFDGNVVVQGLPATNFTTQYVMDPGQRTIGFRNAAGVTATVPVSVVAFQTFTAIGIPGSETSTLVTEVREDTNAATIADKSKLRVMHLARNAPALDIWRTQPDFETPTRVMTPFEYGATSPYLLSDPGVWSVWVTPAGVATDTLAETGPVTLPSSGRATVFVMDSAGAVVMRVAN